MASSLSSLLKGKDPDPAVVLQAADSALKQSKSESTAQRAKVVALLKLDRFDDAVRFVEAGGKSLREDAAFEYAYALYKTGSLEKAREVVKDLDQLPARHLDGQSSYRSEDFDNARRIYEDLWNNRTEDEESDLRINRGAVNSQIHWSKRGDAASERATREDLEVFETAYNAACGCLARGEFAQGEMLLKRARDLCAASEDLSDQDKQSELLPISVQQLFALTVQGKTEAAEAVAKELAVADIPDLSTRQIAQANKMAIHAQPSNPYLAQRLLESLPSLPPSDQLFGVQSSKMRQNRISLDLLISKFGAASAATKPQGSEALNPGANADSVARAVQHAAAEAQNQLGKLGVDAVRKLNLQQENNVGFALVLVQLYILTKNHGAAITVMENLVNVLDTAGEHDARFAPGLIAVLVSLYGIEKRRGDIEEELGKAASYWRRKSRVQPRLFNAAGLALLAAGRPEDLAEAGKIFEAAKSAGPNDSFAEAGYIAALAPSQHSKVAADAQKLTSVEKLTAGIDAAALDEAGIPQLKPAAKAAGRKRAAEEAAKPAKKRVRKSRLSKDHDPEKKPDLERWLPLRDRSTYKPKGKKGKQKQQTLTQGGIAKEGAEEVEAAKTSVVKASGGAGGAGKTKKTKKKK